MNHNTSRHSSHPHPVNLNTELNPTVFTGIAHVHLRHETVPPPPSPEYRVAPPLRAALLLLGSLVGGLHRAAGRPSVLPPWRLAPPFLLHSYLTRGPSRTAHPRRRPTSLRFLAPSPEGHTAPPLPALPRRRASATRTLPCLRCRSRRAAPPWLPLAGGLPCSASLPRRRATPRHTAPPWLSR
jgi:hypothetical protein